MGDKEAYLKDLMVLSLEGDAGAWRSLLTEMRRVLTPFFQRRLNASGADAEDLVQDCLIALHMKRATYDTSLPFTTWAYAIARYKLIDHLRRQARRRDAPLEDAFSTATEHDLQQSSVRRDLKKVLSILPQRQRQLIQDVRLSGYTLAEAATRRGITEGAAKVSVHRSMKILVASVSTDED